MSTAAILLIHLKKKKAIEMLSQMARLQNWEEADPGFKHGSV